MAIQVSGLADDVVALAHALPIPGLGFSPVNAYLVRAEQPLLVDSGLPASRPDFLQALVADRAADVRWINLTHPDRNHAGSLLGVLGAAPNAHLITTFLGRGMIKVLLQWRKT